jgi:hypothetical protein
MVTPTLAVSSLGVEQLRIHSSSSSRLPPTVVRSGMASDCSCSHCRMWTRPATELRLNDRSTSSRCCIDLQLPCHDGELVSFGATSFALPRICTGPLTCVTEMASNSRRFAFYSALKSPTTVCRDRNPLVETR